MCVSGQAKEGMIRAEGARPVHNDACKNTLHCRSHVDPSQIDGAIARSRFASMGGNLGNREEGVHLGCHVFLNSICPVGFRPTQRGPGGRMGVEISHE